jgi:superfamily II RNA helicase
VCPTGGAGLHLVQDERGRFDEAQWQSAVAELPRPKPPQQSPSEDAPRDPDPTEAASTRALKRCAEVIRVVGRFEGLAMLPAIVFCFSRRECELIATQMGRAVAAASADATRSDAPRRADGGGSGRANAGAAGVGVGPLPLLSDAEVAQVEQIFEGAVRILAEEDILHPTPASYMLHPTSYTLPPTSLHPTSCILHPTSNITSCTLHPTGEHPRRGGRAPPAGTRAAAAAACGRRPASLGHAASAA